MNPITSAGHDVVQLVERRVVALVVGDEQLVAGREGDALRKSQPVCERFDREAARVVGGWRAARADHRAAQPGTRRRAPILLACQRDVVISRAVARQPDGPIVIVARVSQPEAISSTRSY